MITRLKIEILQSSFFQMLDCRLMQVEVESVGVLCSRQEDAEAARVETCRSLGSDEHVLVFLPLLYEVSRGSVRCI